MLVAGADPLLFSHGQERGPLAVRFTPEWKAHGNGKVRWLRVPGMPRLAARGQPTAADPRVRRQRR